jgi:gluconate 5-dehydrogenase
VALVTGGGRGIGEFISRGLAEAGANLAIGSRNLQNCRKVADELEKIGRRVLAVECDVTKVEDIEKLVKETVRFFSRIDILVNNAGITWGAMTLDYPLEKWDRIMAANLRAPFLLSQKVAKIMICEGGGKIINIASVTGLRGTPEELHPAIAYSTSKGGLITFTKDLAVKLAPYNIQVNAIAPGTFLTDMMSWTEVDKFKHVKEAMIREIPLGRSAGEEDIKGVAVFLASPASNYLTGAIVPVDGGLTAK